MPDWPPGQGDWNRVPTYASKTTVDASQSRDEIERTLERYGASSFAYSKMETEAVIIFDMHDRRVMFRLPLPARSQFTQTETGRSRKSQNAIDEAYQQAVRQRWRALALVIKAKLESIESGIETFDEAFMPHILLPGGKQTISAWMVPQIEKAYESGQMPPLMITAG